MQNPGERPVFAYRSTPFMKKGGVRMWTRAELKNRAKMCLSRYYWAAFAVSLIFAILSGFGGSNANTQRVTSYLEQSATGSSRDDQSGLLIGELGGDGSLSGSTQSGLASGIELVPGLGDAYGPGAGNAGSMVASNLFYRLFAGAVVVIVIVSVVIGIFVQPLFEVGRNRFYLESRVTGQSAGVGKIFWGFSNGYLKIVGTQFLRGLITESVVILASLLGFLAILFNGVEWIGSVFWAVMICATIGAFVSVYFQYCYLMVPYILAENPDMKTMEVLRLSKEMMDGQKWNAFVLGLSFLGWQLLGTLLCGIGTFFVQPYVDATFAELYAVLRGPYSGRLNGFGGEPFVQNNARYGGQYVEPDSVRDVGGNENPGGGYGAYGTGNMNGGYGQNGGTGYSYGQGQNSASDSWNDMPQEPYQYHGPEQTVDSSAQQQADAEDRGTEVKRSEGGPGRGYYLNGKFYPYTDDEKDGQ